MHLSLLLIAGCLDTPSSIVDTGVTTSSLADAPVDLDADGYSAGEDCDDSDPTVHPNQPERCDGIDDNCNGLADEGFADSDGDATADCIDTEECDGLDNNGDGLIDEGYPDSDGDGAADCTAGESCDGLDNDGDGLVDEGFDLDGDGLPPCGPTPDCDDTDAGVYPGAAESTDGLDNDCNGLVDEHDLSPGDLSVTELMVNPADVPDPNGEWIELENTSGGTRHLDGLTLSTGGAAYTLAAGLSLEPGERIVLARFDNETVEASGWYADLLLSNEGGTLEVWAADRLIDAVAWGTVVGGEGAWSLDPLAEDNAQGAWWCQVAETPGTANTGCPAYDHDGDGLSGDEGDCDDTDAEVYPGAEEVWYDGTDSDCDGNDDDQDGDGYGIEDDCDDTDALSNPGAAEVCDGLDNDCDGLSDEDADDGAQKFADADGDGHGDPDAAAWVCGSPSGYVSAGDDCDDDDAAVSPSAEEVCDDSVDDDCDGAAQYCDEDGYSIGGDDWDWTTRGYYRANIFQAQSAEELLRYAVYLELPAAGCDLEFIVYSATSLTGSWSREWSETLTTSRSGWISTSGIELETTEDTYYSLGVGWSCSATFFADYGSFTGDDGGIGDFAGNHYDNTYGGASGFVPASVGAGSFAYAQVVYIAE